MGLSMLPDELLLSLQDQWPCRETQLRQLAALLSLKLPSPPTLVIYGPHATGKSSVISSYLVASKLQHAIVRCKECVTGRHLLERTVAAIRQSLKSNENEETEGYTGRCESLSALTVQLERLFASHTSQEKFTLVFDGIERQREAPPTLLPALARLGEYVPALTVVLMVQHPPPRFLHQTSMPYVYFAPYTRNQSLHILSRSPPDIFLEQPPTDLEYDDETHDEDKAWLWPRFCAAVWDSLAQSAARDLVSFRRVCQKLWRPFVAPVVKGEFGTRDFSRLLVAQRRLLQDESVLLDSLISKPTTTTSASSLTPATTMKSTSHDLPYYAKWLLISAYLASFNPARLDALYFMKSTEKKRRKKGGGTARSGGGRPSQKRIIPRHLLAPSPFPLDRLLSILHGILPHDLRSTIDIYTQIATLASLRLLVRVGGIGSSDSLEPGGKWKVGVIVSWEYVLALARSVDFGIADYVAE